ncbi:Bidirectional sugar transporter SWEET10-like [Parasponia andersonii]|uniref:Bidirectional sugar transporter SWEET n=1 Tax=Parasponia andersonii TaxID=3476 RepID=A0A2P5DVC6_PARAD|nr:Bidirectional sugar transporter SWEET10-like [Parasponia andersonii]
MAPHHYLTFAFGLLGNIVSFMMFLAPIPTFHKIYKKKSAEGFQSLPYVVALLSSMLWIYYALLKKDAMLLITINSFGCVIETVYIALFIFYAPKKSRMETVKLLLLLNVFGYGLMLVLTTFLAKGEKRLQAVGWICLVFNLSVFAAPLCIMRQVIKTKSVEFMPFPLSFFLTLGAVMWFFYGLLLKDYNIAVMCNFFPFPLFFPMDEQFPNVLGFIFGIAQMALYIIYKNAKKTVLQEPKLQELSEHVIDVVKISTLVCSAELNPVVLQQSNDDTTTHDDNGRTGNDKIESENVKEKTKKEAAQVDVLAPV